jgi:hypothetical protein
VSAGVALAADADLPVALGAGLTAPSSFLLSLKGAAEGAAEVSGCKPSLFCIGSARSARGAGAGAADTAGKFSGLSLKGAAEGAAKVVDGDPSPVSCLAAGLVAGAPAAGDTLAAGAALAALAAGGALAGSVPASAGRPK